MTELKTPYDNVAFLFFLSHWELLKELTPEECMRVLQAVFACAGANCEIPEEMNRMERAVFKSDLGRCRALTDQLRRASRKTRRSWSQRRP